MSQESVEEAKSEMKPDGAEVAASAAPREAEAREEEPGAVKELREEMKQEAKDGKVEAVAGKGDDGGRDDAREEQVQGATADPVKAQPLRSLEPSRDEASASEQELKVAEASPAKLPATEQDTTQEDIKEGAQDVQEVTEQQASARAPDRLGGKREREDDDFPAADKADEGRDIGEHVEDSEINDKIKKAEELLMANESPVAGTRKQPDQSKSPMAEKQQQDPTKLEGAPAGKGASFSFGKQQPEESAAMASQPADGVNQQLRETSDSMARDPHSDLMNAQPHAAAAGGEQEDKKSSSSIDTNELTDMDRKESLPLHAAADVEMQNQMIEVANQQEFTGQLEQQQANARQVERMPTFAGATPNASYRASAERDNESLQPISKDSMLNTESDLAANIQQLKVENQQQRKVIEELQGIIKQKDAEMQELRAYYESQENQRRKVERLQSGPTVENKLQILKKGMARAKHQANSDIAGLLPAIKKGPKGGYNGQKGESNWEPEQPYENLRPHKSQIQLESKPKKEWTNEKKEWSIGQINTRNHKLKAIGRAKSRGRSEQVAQHHQGKAQAAELPPIKGEQKRRLKGQGGFSPAITPANGRGSADLGDDRENENLVQNRQVQKFNDHSNAKESPILAKNKKFKALENNFSKNKEKYALAKLEALKFKMQLQNKNLKLLTQQDELMTDIYREEKGSNIPQKAFLRRENRAVQNQQIVRIEKDLERTSRQLQAEIAAIQEQDKTALTEQILADIDGLFDDAEAYFTRKQEQIVARTNASKRGYGQVQSKINTNLQSLEQVQPQSKRNREMAQIEDGPADESARGNQEAPGDYYNPYGKGPQNYGGQDMGGELEELHQEREDNRKQRNLEKMRDDQNQQNRAVAGEELSAAQVRLARKEKKASLPPGAHRSPRRAPVAPTPKKDKHAGVLNYQDYDMAYLQNEEKGDLLEIQKQYYLHDQASDNHKLSSDNQ